MKKLIIILASLLIVGILLVFGINFYVVLSTKNQFSNIEDLKKLKI